MPRELTPDDLSLYPPQAKQFALDNIGTLRSLPPILCALLLKQIREFDWLFPAERSDLEGQLRWLSTSDRNKVAAVITPFQSLPVTKSVMELPWAPEPGPFIEKLTADLWATHSMDAFQSAGKKYGDILQAVRENPPSTNPRLCVVFIGAGSPRGQQALFEKLRPYGTYFSQADMSGGTAEMGRILRVRASAQPGLYQHWYVDGGVLDPTALNEKPLTPGIETLSYDALEPVRKRVIDAMYAVRTSGGAGPERLRSILAQMSPEEHAHREDNPLIRNFTLRLFTEGSGTQIFSTTFVQWAGREVLRRAQPQTLFLRFQPRQTERPMDELMSTRQETPVISPEGSLLDGDMGAFYTWINLQRLPGGAESRFLACYEGGHEALVVAPGIPKDTTSDSKCSLKDLLQWSA
jgi:hypothetical protein